MAGISDDAKRNREDWTQANAAYTDARASHNWARRRSPGASSACPKSSLGTLGEVDGLDVVELGCGTAYVSAWLARRGARPVGVDVTPAQLATARRCQAEFGLEFPLVEASAEDVPCRPRASTSPSPSTARASGATPTSGFPRRPAPAPRRSALVPPQQHPLDPLRARREASRARRCNARSAGWVGSSGRTSSASSGSCRTASSSACSGERGFEVLDLVELYAPDDAVDHAYYDAFSAEWARKWPAEEIWVAKKPG